MVCEICSVSLSGEGDKSSIRESKYWVLALANNQAYLGRGFLSVRRHIESISDISPDEWLDLKTQIGWYESRVKKLWGASLFNWTCNMNDAYKKVPAQPHVHWHVWPRYDHDVLIDDVIFSDPNFAHHYDKYAKKDIDKNLLEKIATIIGQ